MQSKFTLAATLGLATLGLATVAGAQAQSQKVAWLDMQQALLSTTDGQNTQAELKKKFEPKENEFQKRQQEIQSKQAQYQKTANTMSDAAKAAAERDVQNLSRTLQRDNEDAQQDFQTEENRVLTPLLQKMQGVINKYAADNQIAIVVDASRQQNNLIYADPAADITKAIVLLYNQAPAPSAPAPAAAKPPAPPPAAGPKPTTAAPARPATPAPKPF